MTAAPSYPNASGSWRYPETWGQATGAALPAPTGYGRLEQKRKGIHIANRNFSPNALSLSKKYVTLHARIAIGGLGAPTLQALNKQTGAWAAAPSTGWNGIKSVALNSAGNYTLVLQDSYVQLLAGWVGFAQDAAPAAPNTQVMATGTNVRSATSPQVTIQTRAAATATNPASGEVLIVALELEDSTAV